MNGLISTHQNGGRKITEAKFIELLPVAVLEESTVWQRLHNLVTGFGIAVEVRILPTNYYTYNHITVYGGDVPIYTEHNDAIDSVVANLAHEFSHWLTVSPKDRLRDNFGLDQYAHWNCVEEAKACVVQNAIHRALGAPVLYRALKPNDFMKEANTWWDGETEIHKMLGTL